MGLFNRTPKPNNGPVDLNAPFVFRIDGVFSITGRGRVFTGTVESGTVPIGAPATLVVGNRVVLGHIKLLESRKQRKPLALETGATGAIGLDGVDTNDFPLRAYGGDMIVDDEALKGAVIRSRQAADAPPTLQA